MAGVLALLDLLGGVDLAHVGQLVHLVALSEIKLGFPLGHGG